MCGGVLIWFLFFLGGGGADMYQFRGGGVFNHILILRGGS